MGMNYDHRQADVNFNHMVGKPAEADESLGDAYRALLGFKQGLDAMHEIPAQLKPLYQQVMKAIDNIAEARKHTYQLREMTKKTLNTMGR